MDVWVPDNPVDGIPLNFFNVGIRENADITNKEIKKRFFAVQEYGRPQDRQGNEILSISHLIDSTGVVTNNPVLAKWSR